MTEEQRAEAKAQMQAKWDEKKANASEGELALMNEWEARRTAWDALTEEERAANKEQYKTDKEAFQKAMRALKWEEKKANATPEELVKLEAMEAKRA